MRRIVMIRHGETVGESSIRFYGSTDVELSKTGEDQMRAARAVLDGERFDFYVASPKQRSWKSAQIVSNSAPVRLESDFREIHFGRWEGLTREEIQAEDPVLAEDWISGAAIFEYPHGEPRAEFRARVEAGLERLLASSGNSALLVLHKGVIRIIHEKLTGSVLEEGQPDLGCVVELTQKLDGSWAAGRSSSNPAGLDAVA